MSDLSSQTAQNSENISQSSAFADALQRAKQIAAKINPAAGAGVKRPHESLDMDVGGPDGKRAAGMTDPFGSQLAALRDGAAMAGAAAAAPPLSIGGMETEEITVPDRMVGLIIGRGGESINRLQSESGAKIQMAPACVGDSQERVCTITGARVNIERAKDLVQVIIQSRAGERDRPLGGASGAVVPMSGIGDMLSSGGGDQSGHTTAEVMVPSGKVGLIIGKGGETIKQLQDKSGSKMVVIQDGSYTNAPEKPLRITGDAQQIEYAKHLVFDLMADKEGFRGNTGSFGRPAAFGSGNPVEVTVPQAAVGVVIGKGGEMIKKIQSDSGCNIQFQQNMAGRNERVCTLNGTPDQVEHAKMIIHDLIDSVMKRDQGGPPGNNGFNNGARNGSNWTGGGGPPGHFGGRPMGRNDKTEICFPVPALKCGIVIGKGGETIKAINAQTGAYCELDRRPPPNPNEKMFVVKGLPDQVEHAKRLICEKVGIPCGPPGGGPYGGPPGGPGGYPPQGWPNPGFHNPGVWGQQNEPGKPDGWNNYYAQFYGGQGGPGGAPGGPVQQPQNSSAPAVNPQTGQPDYSAQWIEYYRSVGMNAEADSIERNTKANKAAAAVAAGMAPGGPAASQPAAVAAGGGVSNGGQPDYTSQWIEYYRSMGMTGEAEKLEAQLKANKGGGAAAGANSGANTGGAPTADYTDQWIAYYKSQGMMENVAELEKVKQQQQQTGGGGQMTPGSGGAPAAPAGFQPPYNYAGGYGGAPATGAAGGAGSTAGVFGQYGGGGGYPGAGDN